MDWNRIFEKLGGIKGSTGHGFAPVSETEMQGIEAVLGESVPEPYRRFVSQYGLSSFKETTVFVPTEPLPPDLSGSGNGLFTSFLGGACRWEVWTLSYNIKMYTLRGRMPESMIPIGEDSGQGLICLGFAGPERGRVYYWARKYEMDEEDYIEYYGEPNPDYLFHAVFPVAPDFDDFLNRLQVWAPPSERRSSKKRRKK
jgi:hypothetical protein